MRRLERVEDPLSAMRAGLDGRQKTIWTALPGIVQSISGNAVSIQPAIQGIVTSSDNSSAFVNLPLLLDCPIIFASGGPFTFALPIAAGDEALVILASRAIDAWYQSGGVQPPATLRMHSLSDGFALIGPRSVPREISLSASNAQLLCGDEVVMDIPPAGPIVFSRDIHAPNVAASGDVTSDDGSISLTNHVHTGVSAGSVSTGPATG